MGYFELLDDMTVPRRWHLGSILSVDGSEPRLRAGVVCDSSPLRTQVSHPGVELDFCLTSFAVPVARRALVAAIESVSAGDIQRVPVRIAEREGFEVVNVLRVIRCLDENRSKFIKWTSDDHRADLVGQYRQVIDLRVRAEAIPPDVNALRIEGWLVGLVVSEEVKRVMERTGCVGAKFVEVT